MPIITQNPDGSILIAIKAVPGASRDAIAGTLGERLKVRIAAPPEGGKANKAIIALLARKLGVKDRDIELVTGAANPEKLFRVRCIDAAHAERVLSNG